MTLCVVQRNVIDAVVDDDDDDDNIIGAILLGIACIPIFIINWYADALLIWAGQPADVAAAAGTYCRVAMLSLPFNFVYEIFTRALQAQSLVRPNLGVNIIGNLLNAFLCWLLIYEWGLSWLGAAIARTISVAIAPFLLIGYGISHLSCLYVTFKERFSLGAVVCMCGSVCNWFYQTILVWLESSMSKGMVTILTIIITWHISNV
jgi:Na+-driven multidrug efflux pump